VRRRLVCSEWQGFAGITHFVTGRQQGDTKPAEDRQPVPAERRGEAKIGRKEAVGQPIVQGCPMRHLHLHAGDWRLFSHRGRDLAANDALAPSGVGRTIGLLLEISKSAIAPLFQNTIKKRLEMTVQFHGISLLLPEYVGVSVGPPRASRGT
jgi:hypothetical protein